TVVGNRNRNSIEIERYLASRREAAHTDARLVARRDVFDFHSRQIVESFGDVDEVMLFDLILLDAVRYQGGRGGFPRDHNDLGPEMKRRSGRGADNLVHRKRQVRQLLRQFGDVWYFT